MNKPNLSLGSWFSLLLTRLIWGVILAIPAGFLVMFLWNSIVTKAVSGANPLDFLQSVGLLVLCRILFYNGWTTPSRADQPQTRKRQVPEEDRAAFLARIRSRLSEAEASVQPSGSWSSGNHD